MDAVVKVYVTERNDVIKRSSNVIIKLQTYAIETTASEMKGVQGKHYENTPIQIYWKCHHQKLEVFR